jgi:peptide deformylase
MRLKILQAGEPTLRLSARPLTPEQIVSEEIQRLIMDMRETMQDAPGVGLAAPQVGVPIQLAVIEDREDYLKDIPSAQLEERERKPVPFHAIINPKITAATGRKVEFFEGCLSLAGFSAVVPRARNVRVEHLDEEGKAKVVEAFGWYARILQHEIDHLRGNRSRIGTDRGRARRLMKSSVLSEPQDENNSGAGAGLSPAPGFQLLPIQFPFASLTAFTLRTSARNGRASAGGDTWPVKTWVLV